MVLRPVSFALATVAALAACRSAGPPLPPFEPVAMQSGVERSQATRVTEHVLVISIDGLRPDAIERYEARTLAAMAHGGSHTYRARTVSPSRTLPAHVSMLSGVDPTVHGIVWNTDERDSRGPVTVPTVFSVVHGAGLSTAAFFAKTKFVHLVTPASYTHLRLPRFGALGPWAASHTIGLVEEHLRTARPNLLFVHLAEPDAAGHVYGWMSPMYGAAVRTADESVRRLLELADQSFGRGRYTVIVTADHGGQGRSHGSETGVDETIPWIVWGQGVYQRNHPLEADVRTVDTAPTILWLLGLDAPSSWSGRVVTDAFPARR